LKLGFVVPHYAAEGDWTAPEPARDVGTRLAARGHSVEVLTTTALESRTGESVLPAGATTGEGVTVRRFPVTRVREEDGRYIGGVAAPGIAAHLDRHRRDWDALVFVSRACWAAAHGLRLRPTRTVLAAADSHLEVCPGLDGVAEILRVPAALVLDTPEQQRLVERVAGGERVPGEPIGPGVDLAPHEGPGETPAALKGLGPYVLLAGPLEARDGYAVTVERFLRASRDGGAPLTLVLVGRGRISLGESVQVRQLGDLSEAATRAVVRGALAVLVPSRREALAPSALLAWSLGRPVLAHRPGVVMRGLVARAGGGVACASDDELAAALDLLVAEPALAKALGAQGHDHVAGHHSWPVVMEEWERLLARVAAGREALA
jgi:glycosyltransferase involved in cell wall biosynthesis